MSRCEKCGNLNKPGAKFCKVCGEPITVCKQCGTSATAPALAPPNGPEPSPRLVPAEMPQQRATSPVPKIVAVGCMAAVIAVGGFYFHQRSSAPAAEAGPETAVAPVSTPT